MNALCSQEFDGVEEAFVALETKLGPEVELDGLVVGSLIDHFNHLGVNELLERSSGSDGLAHLISLVLHLHRIQ